VAGWVARAIGRGAIVGELHLSLIEEFRQRGISIPYPQTEVRLIGGGT
jgi:small-conductance mechanosensitive channel